MIAYHLAKYIAKPALTHVGADKTGFYSDVAIWLVVGTAAVESEFRALDQYTGGDDTTLGPAIGFWQMEKATADDIYTNYLSFRTDMQGRVNELLGKYPDRTMQLASNLGFAATMCRLSYWRQSGATMPSSIDPNAYAKLWKQFYNTPDGAGTEAKFLDAWNRLVQPYLGPLA